MEDKGIINGHEYVDLGLSVKWATCNVGASSPEEYGDYWGSTPYGSYYTRHACSLGVGSDYLERGWRTRGSGRSVRPVSE